MIGRRRRHFSEPRELPFHFLTDVVRQIGFLNLFLKVRDFIFLALVLAQVPAESLSAARAGCTRVGSCRSSPARRSQSCPAIGESGFPSTSAAYRPRRRSTVEALSSNFCSSPTDKLMQRGNPVGQGDGILLIAKGERRFLDARRLDQARQLSDELLYRPMQAPEPRYRFRRVASSVLHARLRIWRRLLLLQEHNPLQALGQARAWCPRRTARFV